MFKNTIDNLIIIICYLSNICIYLRRTSKENANWKELPITERLYNKVCKYAIDEDMNVPEVSNGYWFVLDRHSKAKDKYNEEEIFEEDRHSNNFTVAVFDIDAKILYIYEIDT